MSQRAQTRQLRRLITARSIIAVIGGNQEVAALTKRKSQHVTNWKTTGRLPPDTFLIMSATLARKGYQASPKIWGITPVG
jgi:hypothetical protein